jgi:tricarballylate dehydrogenase
MKSSDTVWDVIVVGCGIAGLSAAVSAQEQGARVVVLERSPEDERGGNTRYTGAWFRMKSIDETSEDFEDHFAVNAGGYLDPAMVDKTAEPQENWPPSLRAMSFVDPHVVATFAAEAPGTLNWLTGYGVRFERLETPFLTTVQPRMAPHGGGLALVEALAAQFEKKGGTIVYNTAAQKLMQDERGGVTGLQATGPGNVPVQFHGRSVVLGCGGFQGNAEMTTRYIGPGSLNLRPMSRGCLNNRGEGIRMALDIGAAPCGDFGSWHASPADPRSVRPGPSIYVYAYGVLVNKRGVRFVDEAPGPTDETYESVTREIYAQPEGIAYCILDERLKDVPKYQGQIRTEQPPITATTLPELAKKLGIPEDVFMKTIGEYNAACKPGRYSPLELDGVATEGLAPRKSNWALPIDKGPFMAYPIISSIVFTFGGLKVNSNAQVVNHQGDAIPGLYAAGETMGLYYRNYTGATSVMKGAVFGRIAGRDAAARARG